jgi:hypothetical protein
MPKVELEPGEQVTVTFKDSDGEITVEFREDALLVTADLPDSSGREGVIYEERFTVTQCKLHKRCILADEHEGGCIAAARTGRTPAAPEPVDYSQDPEAVGEMNRRHLLG